MRIEEIFREEHGRILATLIRLLGDFDVAEEALQEAFAVALEQWPGGGTPANPVAWLVSTGRHKAIDRLRRGARLVQKQEEIARHFELSAPLSADDEETPVPEDRLRLIFTCCHPALATEAQVALTLRTLGGLSTEEIARAFLVPAPTMAQRLVRAKAKIRAARIPYQVPPDSALAERLEAVMVVVYLVFNEGYAASFGARLVRHELCEQAIRLGRMLVELLPVHAESKGLLALMLLHDARRETRLDGSGDIVLLEDQDRTRWDRAQIDEGAALVEAALSEGDDLVVMRLALDRPRQQLDRRAPVYGEHVDEGLQRQSLRGAQAAVVTGTLLELGPGLVFAAQRREQDVDESSRRADEVLSGLLAERDELGRAGTDDLHRLTSALHGVDPEAACQCGEHIDRVAPARLCAWIHPSRKRCGAALHLLLQLS